MCVVLSGHASECADVTWGVPKGSVLGPPMYLNDTLLVVTCSVRLFAEDCTV